MKATAPTLQRYAPGSPSGTCCAVWRHPSELETIPLAQMGRGWPETGKSGLELHVTSRLAAGSTLKRCVDRAESERDSTHE